MPETQPRATERACILLADISGYTAYLAGVELDHAQDVLADLMNTVIDALRPLFRLHSLEGDAAFTYALADTIDGSSLLDAVEGCYAAFQQRLLSIRQASACECNACVLIPQLDLKFVVHHGQVGRFRIGRHDQLVGPDVILAHRLLKNRVSETHGLRGYALYTQGCIDATALEPTALGMTSQRESYDVGEVICWIEDLGAVWARERERQRVYVGEREATWSVSGDVPAPPEVAWEMLTSPSWRPLWQEDVTGIGVKASGNRRGAGAQNHCMHGRDVTIEDVLDWRPPRYQTHRVFPGDLRIVVTYELVPTADGTRIEVRARPDGGPRMRAGLEARAEFLTAVWRRSFERLAAVAAEEVRTRAAAAAELPPEPELATPDPGHRQATARPAPSG